jgi:hypothetical protein
LSIPIRIIGWNPSPARDLYHATDFKPVTTTATGRNSSDYDLEMGGWRSMRIYSGEFTLSTLSGLPQVEEPQSLEPNVR